jgi:predicted acyltransferase
MVNGSPDSKAMGWSATLWSALLYAGALFALVSWSALGPLANRAVRLLGWLLLVFLAADFRGRGGQRIFTLVPFALHPSWWGILGLIGWAYLAASAAFLFIRRRPAPLLGAVALLLCLYPAHQTGFFAAWRITHVVSVRDFGAHASIAVAGALFAVAVYAHAPGASRIRYAALFFAGFAAAAILLRGLYGINKDEATPSWCLWSCAITALLWAGIYAITEWKRFAPIAAPLGAAGRNVLLAYLLSEGLKSFLDLFHVGGLYDFLAGSSLAGACLRSAGCAVILLALTVCLNRAGFRVRL